MGEERDEQAIVDVALWGDARARLINHRRIVSRNLVSRFRRSHHPGGLMSRRNARKPDEMGISCALARPLGWCSLVARRDTTYHAFRGETRSAAHSTRQGRYMA